MAAGLMWCRAPSAPLPQRPAFDTEAPPALSRGLFLVFLSERGDDPRTCLKTAGKPTNERRQGEFWRQAEEAMERSEFLRKQADRFLRLAQDCTDPKIRQQLVSMANEYRAMLEGSGPESQAGVGKAS